MRTLAMRALAIRTLVPACLAAGALLSVAVSAAQAEDPVRLYAAGSLKATLTDVADAFEAAGGGAVDRTFGPSGLLRQRIEDGETAHLFASANMKHPRTLAGQGRGMPVALFARNRLCALARPEVAVSTETLLDTMLSDGVRLGTSTPGADPSGDYAFALFAKAEAVRTGAQAALEAKALKLTGGPDSAKAPDGRNTYGWVLDSDQADVFLTYCTNAVLARREVSNLQQIAVPAPLSVGADYGLLVLDGAPDAAYRLALFVLSPEGQTILDSYGFDAQAVPAAK